MKEFSVTIRIGIDDLLSWSPYQNGHDWPTFSPFYEITEEEYLTNPKDYEQRVQAQNDQYIKDLKSQGTYGDPYTTHFKFNELPEFDNNKAPDYSNFGLFIPAGNIDKAYDNPKMSYVFKKEDDENKDNK